MTNSLNLFRNLLPDASRSDFQELAWITKETFQGLQTQEGVKYYVYKLDDQMAWVSESTLLPMRFESNSQEVTYTYKEPPAEALHLPEKYVQKLEQVKRAWTGR